MHSITISRSLGLLLRCMMNSPKNIYKIEKKKKKKKTKTKTKKQKTKRPPQKRKEKKFNAILFVHWEIQNLRSISRFTQESQKESL